MGDEVLNSFEEEILRLMGELSELDPKSEEYQKVTARIQELSQQGNNGRKIVLDWDAKTDADNHDFAVKQAELELKKEELALKSRELDVKEAEDKRKGRNGLISDVIKGGVEICGIVIPLKWYAKFLQQGYLFEQKNIVSSVTFKNFLRFLKPRK